MSIGISRHEQQARQASTVMGTNEHRKQKKLAKQKAKRAEKKADVVRHGQTSHRDLLKLVETSPIHEALIPTKLWTQGIGQLVISRKLPDGRIAAAILLLDVFCLGVKSSIFMVDYPTRYATRILEMSQRISPLTPVAPESFAKLVFGCIDFAAQFGFKPDADFADCQHVLANIDYRSCTEPFTYGKEGKPFYVRGPHETFVRAQEIIATVQAAGGEYMLHLDDDEIAKYQRTGALNMNPNPPQAIEDSNQ